ncbi:MAG: glutamate formimidoyltransferase [Bacilli bacterium]|nr:glutamate formimidoyltransferase [Bacilli bacterium]
MQQIIEIVPNYSEGIDANIMQKIIAPFQNSPLITLVDLEMDASYHRSVVTIIGEAKTVLTQMVLSAQIALELIDLRKHKGEHPRMGAIDVCPIIPIANISEQECITLSKELAKEINEKTNIPVYLYSKSASREQCVLLPDIRQGEFEGLRQKMLDPKWAPDFGDSKPHESAGALAVGCRKPLVAFNIDMNSNDKAKVLKIARRIRFSSGGYRFIQAGAARLKERNICQVTMNLTDYTQTALYQALEATIMEGKRYQISVVSSEIVGLVPKDCLVQSLKYYLGFEEDHVLELSLDEIVTLAIKHFKLRDFHVKKVIEYYVHS